MNGFSRTLAYGLAALCLVFLSGVVTAVVVMRSKGLFEPSTLRAIALTKEERDWLDTMRTRPPEKAEIGTPRAADDQDVLERIAEMANADRTARLVGEIKLQKQSLDERSRELERQWSEYQLAKADLARVQSQLEAKQQKIEAIGREQADERARWAQTQLSEKNWVDEMNVFEKQRYADQAKIFELMKDAAWASLRRFEPREIARYLALMAPNKAALILKQAAADPEFRDLVPVIHHEMMRVDVQGAAPNQAERLADLYALMPPETVVPYLRDATPQDIADILVAMGKRSVNDKKRAALLEALRGDNSKRELEVRRLLADGAPTTGPAQEAQR